MKIKNLTGEVVQLHTHEFSINEELDIDSSWSTIDSVLVAIANEEFAIYVNDVAIEGVANQLKILRGDIQSVSVESIPSVVQSPFAAKSLTSGNLFRRIVGKTFDVVEGDNSCKIVIDFPHCKITGVEIINSSFGDVVDFCVLDSATGMLTGVPSFKLNQFGFDVVMSDEKYSHMCPYDSDLYAGLQVEMNYNTTVASKKIGVNLILNEVKP